MNEKALRILKKTIYANIATCSPSGEPWNSPVYVVYDEALHFYWASGRMSQHSKNILTNPLVSLVIYDSSVPWGTGEGLFVQAKAEEVRAPEEIVRACQLRKARVPDANQPPEDFSDDCPRRIYRATSEKMWVNQDAKINGFFVDERAEIDMHQLRTMLTN